MRIGVDVSCWNNTRGFGRFTRELLTQLFELNSNHDFVAFTDDAVTKQLGRFGIEIVQVQSNRRVVDAAVANDHRSLSDIVAFRRAAKTARLDAIYYPAVYSWFPPPTKVKSFVTFHDAIAEHFPELVFPGYRQRILWNVKTWLAKKTASRIITVSNTAQQEIVKYLRIPASKIDVICEGAGQAFSRITDRNLFQQVRLKFNLPNDSRILVYVGGFAPHKNLLRLLQAFSEAVRYPCGHNLALVLVGDPEGAGFHSEYNNMINVIERTPELGNRVFWTGYASDSDLAVLLSNAIGLIMPSLSEGFGLPALEAMSCGAPVLAAKDGAVMEVAGTAGLAFDPLDVESIKQTILELAGNGEVETALRAATAAEAKRNTWKRGAELLLDAFDRSEASL